ncbi:transposase [Herbivorax sp. ANBcel31]|uniref:REP-associated tyrosine transposase n=1 Tax=Herbivorax sp. ANBcel31 TaxID=3069754 RepID=UPI0027AE4B1A|nr:transposase [Herbivorax sp. ANBcel31]MDQ2087486.1 transposase [Herbivorax sp. ANBcel31]
MPRHERVRSNSGYYHIMIRGNERRVIFCNDDDRIRFMKIIRDKKQDDRFCLQAFCLMGNHVHLMMREGKEDISKVMKRITVSYVHYFNNKYKRAGHLFQGRFKSEVVEEDNYVLALARYIHNNPVKAGIVKRASDYKWSSYNTYIDEENSYSDIIDKHLLLGIFSENKNTAIMEYKKFMNQESNESFIDLEELQEIMSEKEAKELFLKMLLERGLNAETKGSKVPDDLLKDFREKTGFSIRKISSITGINKDTVNRALKHKK